VQDASSFLVRIAKLIMKVNEPLTDDPNDNEWEWSLCSYDGHFCMEYKNKLYCYECGIYLGESKRNMGPYTTG
jgi:hypothetical protein